MDDFRREYPALGDVPEVETMGGLMMTPAGRGAGAGGFGEVSRVETHGATHRRTPRAGVAGGGVQVRSGPCLQGHGQLRHQLGSRLDGGHLLIWIGFVVCLVLSFLLSGMEAGVFALSRLRIRQQMRAGRRSAEVLHRYLENPEDFLWTILVGNTLANFCILGLAGRGSA